MDLTQQTIGKLRQMLDRKEVSAPELTKAYLDRIAAYDKTIQSYITVTAERMFHYYVKPQATGNRTDVRWMELADFVTGPAII